MAQREFIPTLDTHGAKLHRPVISRADIAVLSALADTAVAGRAGVRVFGHPCISALFGRDGSAGQLAATLLGEAARPVRAIMFDKTWENNWSVPWHQDRTIAVQSRRDVPGFGPWSIKTGVSHVEPPFEVMARMITMRAHLDDCETSNAPLLVVPGSHRFGRIPAAQAAVVAQRHGHIPCCASAGDIWVYATPIVHASERARIPGRRRVLQVDYAAEPLPGGLEWLGIAP
jgi:hypothetical protein